MLEALGAMAGVRARLWRFDGRRLRPTGGDPGWTPTIPRSDGMVPTPDGSVWLAAVPQTEGFWLEVAGAAEPRLQEGAGHLARVLGALLAAERETAEVTEELAGRYEEIDLLYTISEILGHTLRLEEAAQTIVREVSTVVGARRASIMVHDQAGGVLRTVAARGFTADGLQPVETSDRNSIAARVWRENRIAVYDPTDPLTQDPGHPDGRNYRGQAFLSIPICYAAPGASSRCVGVINLTDRLGGDAFTAGNRKLVSAIANQIGAAIENARLVARDLEQQRIRHELELAHDLQLKLLPSPSVLQGDALVAALCRPVESVGGDFY
ncbi:MAG: GAF domain-containing protein, partial [Gemmatimonadales bacterium]